MPTQPTFDPTPPTVQPDGSSFSDPVWQRWFSGLGAGLKALVAWLNSSFMPLTGGSFSGDVTFRARAYYGDGTAALPSISFWNDGAPDTGFFHSADGVFNITNNTQWTWQFSTGGSYCWRRLSIDTTSQGGGNDWPLLLANTGGGNLMVLTGSGTTSTNTKYLRNMNGVLDIVNSNFSASIWALTDDGHMSATYIGQTSDEGLKRSWGRLKPGLVEGMAGLRAKNRAGKFTWIANGDRTAGLGAQSVEKFAPWAVHTDPYGLKSVQYGTLAALAVVELSERVLMAEAEVKRLSELLQELTDRVAQAEWREGRR